MDLVFAHPYVAILFDMDGVITDTRQSVTAFWQALAAEKEITLTPAAFDEHIYGRPAAHTLEALFSPLDETENAAMIQRMLDYETHLTYREIRGAGDLLRALRRAGLPAALVTSGEGWKVSAVLGQLGLDGLFTACITAADIRHGKPDPEGYLLGARALGVSPERCIVFEDAIVGVQAAVRAGALCVGVNDPARAAPLLAAGAHRVIPDLAAAVILPTGDAQDEMNGLPLAGGAFLQL